VAAAIQAVQVLLYGMPSDGGPYYWFIYDTTTDFSLLALSLAIYCSLSYASFGAKFFTFGMVCYFIYCAAANIVTDYFVNPESHILGMALFTGVTCVLIFSFRFVFTFKTSNTPIEQGKIYLLTSAPKSLAQIGAAMVTGRGGSFSVTDGVHTWKFMEDVSLLCKVPFKQEHINKKMVEEIINQNEKIIVDLDSNIGRKWTSFYNCVSFWHIYGNQI